MSRLGRGHPSARLKIQKLVSEKSVFRMLSYTIFSLFFYLQGVMGRKRSLFMFLVLRDEQTRCFFFFF